MKIYPTDYQAETDDMNMGHSLDPYFKEDEKHREVTPDELIHSLMYP